jgi:hypothetical protein
VSGFFNEPDSCRYEIHVVWADGTRSDFEGIGLTADKVAEGLEEVAANIRETLRIAAGDSTEASA